MKKSVDMLYSMSADDLREYVVKLEKMLKDYETVNLRCNKALRTLLQAQFDDDDVVNDMIANLNRELE